ncbi:hypothetical protein L3X38_041656 [Prunus dulcis]|uniref:Uncharacterized protein n=1 Tax=Prunus dulcis TaxID=3755 RepID=A0AAD4UTN6_PRUDU|nr:hypothetical protein L3X38_041656 [Prunus dulcis]
MASNPCPRVRDTIIHHHPSKPRKARWGPRPIANGHTCQAGPTRITSQVGEEERRQEDILLAQHCATSLGPDLTQSWALIGWTKYLRAMLSHYRVSHEIFTCSPPNPCPLSFCPLISPRVASYFKMLFRSQLPGSP